MKLQIKILSGGRKGGAAVFSKPAVAVGRHPSADIRFDPDFDLDVSARHAQLDLQDGHWYVRDLGSSNGTFINGYPLKTITRLGDTDQLRFGTNGPTMEIRLVPDTTPDQALGPIAAKASMPDTGPHGVRTTPVSGPPAAAGAARPTGGSTTQRIRAEVVRQTKTLRNTTVGLGVLLVLAVGAFLFNARHEQQLREQQAALMQQRVDSVLHASDAALRALRGQVEGLDTALRQSQGAVQSLRLRLADAQRAGNVAEVADLSRQLTARSQTLSQQQVAAQVDYRAINAANGPAIALIYVQFGPGDVVTGTAFAIDAAGTMITNRHVVAGEDGTKRPQRIAIKFNGSSDVLRADLLGFAPDVEIAAVRVHMLRGAIPPTIKGFNSRPDTVQQGDPVVAIGFPLGVELPMSGSGSEAVARTTLTAGIVSKALPDLIQVDGYGAQGSSGSPIFDRNGEVIAVLYGGQAGTGGRIVFAAPATYVTRFLRSIK